MGIESLSDAFFEDMKRELKSRLERKRFEHSLGVSTMAVHLAEVHSVDPQKARLAGLIHDWDKSYNDKEIRDRVHDLGIVVDPEVFETMPRLLHGVTAAAALRRDYPEIGEEVLHAVECHTSGDRAMSDLDMVVYVADALEYSRPHSTMAALRDLIGKISLEDLFLQTYKQIFLHLLNREYAMHPDTLKVWNYYARRAQERKIKTENRNHKNK